MANICFGGLNLGVLYRMLCGPSFAEENFKCHFVPPAYKQRKPVYQRLNDRIFFSLYYRLTVTRSRSANGFYRQKKRNYSVQEVGEWIMYSNVIDGPWQIIYNINCHWWIMTSQAFKQVSKLIGDFYLVVEVLHWLQCSLV